MSLIDKFKPRIILLQTKHMKIEDSINEKVTLKNCLVLTLFKMGIFVAAHRWEEGGKIPLQNLSHILYNNETWHTYTLPKEYPKTI